MTDDEALSEAEHVLRLIKGLDIKCKIWYDLEDPGTTQKLSNAAIASIAKTFCNRISKAGYSVGIYASKYWFNNILNLPVYEEWPKWVAQYNSVCTYEGSYLMWQYSSTGKVPGLYGNSGNVDMNYAFSGQNISRKDADTYEVNKGNIGYLNTPKNVEGNAVASDEVSVSWNRVENAVSYGVYRSRYKAGKYKMIGKTNSTSYVDKSVSAGETYYYKIRAVSSDSSSKYSSKVTVKTMVGTVENLATGIRNTSELMLTWEGNAKEYEVYMSTGLKKKFTKVRVVDKNRAVISGLKFGKTYYFKVRGREKLKDNQILRGDFSVIISAKTSVGRASGVAVKSDKAGEITVSYNKENGVNGYCVYLATDKDGTYKNVSDTSKTTCVKNGLVSGKKYYVMVRMYKMNGNKKIWGEFSYIKGIVVK